MIHRSGFYVMVITRRSVCLKHFDLIEAQRASGGNKVGRNFGQSLSEFLLKASKSLLERGRAGREAGAS
jgi:hypothetical protein